MTIQATILKSEKEAILQHEKKLKALRSKLRFISFLSPGTLVSEESTFELNKGLDLKKVVKQAEKITERHGAKPYGFRIIDGNHKVLSGIYWLTGTVLLYANLPNRHDMSVLRDNMRINKKPIAIVNFNSYRFTYWFDERDVVIDWDGNVVRRGDDADLMAYRRQFLDDLKK